MELNLSEQSFRDLAQKAIDLIVEHVQKCLPCMDCTMYKTYSEQEAAIAARRFAAGFEERHAPEEGKPVDDVLQTVSHQAMQAGINVSAGGFCGFVNGGGILHTAVAEFLAVGLNVYTGTWQTAPALVQLECNVIKWMCQMINFPEEAFGCFTSGGSMANFIGLVIAREQLGEEEIHKMVVYVTSETHGCVAKSARMAGVQLRNIHRVSCDDEHRMDPTALQKAIQETKSAGLKPLVVIATAGTTNDGTVDDLRHLSQVCGEECVWLHVDGVYGAAFSLTDRGKEVLAGLERANSVAIDFQKSFFLPGATGMLVTRQQQHLRHAFSTGGEAYLADTHVEDVDFNQLTPELTRHYRGLRIWLPLQLCGLCRWREALNERLDWTETLFTGLTALSEQGIELLKKPQLTIVAFRYNPKIQLRKKAGLFGELSERDLKEVNFDLMQFVNQRDHIFITPTTFSDGRYFLRVCVLNVRLTWALLERGLVDIRDGVIHLNNQHKAE